MLTNMSYCNGPGCFSGCGSDKGFCNGHWELLPKELKEKIRRTFKEWEGALAKASKYIEKHHE